MNTITRSISKFFCCALIAAAANGCVTEGDQVEFGNPVRTVTPHNWVSGNVLAMGPIEQHGPEMIDVPIVRDPATIELTPTEVDALTTKIASITPTHFGASFDYETFLDLDLGGIMTTDVQGLSNCRSSSYNADFAHLLINYNCEGLHSLSAPNGSMSCNFERDTVGPLKQSVARVYCNYNFATQVGELAGVLHGTYSRPHNRLLASVDATIYTDSADFDIDVAASFAIDRVLDNCSQYSGQVHAFGATNNQVFSAELDALNRCQNSCRAAGGAVKFTVTSDQSSTPSSSDTLTYLLDADQWLHVDAIGTRTMHTTCD